MEPDPAPDPNKDTYVKYDAGCPGSPVPVYIHIHLEIQKTDLI